MSYALIHRVRLFRSLVFGFVTLEASGAFGDRRSLDASFHVLESSLEKLFDDCPS